VVDGANPRTVDVAFGATAEVTFAVRCGPEGRLQVTTATTGVDLDLNGYSVNLRREGVSSSADVRVPANGTFTFSGLLPADYLLTLSDIMPNCDASGPNPRRITVGEGNLASTGLDITCSATTPLAFVNGTGGKAEIYVVNSNGSGLQRLTSNSVADTDPAWSPDGSRIAFTSERDGNREIYVMNANGTNPVRLTNVKESDDRPAWSPDGARIAFVSERDGGNSEIYVMNADGTNPVRITTDHFLKADPTWSPDGHRIAFMSIRGDRVGAGIWVMNADGSGQTQLTSNDRGDWQPAWSPDGTRIAFSCGVSATSGTREICLVNADGIGLMRLTQNSQYAVDPSWSADGRKIAFELVLEYDFYYPGPSHLGVVGIDGLLYSSPTDLAEASNPSWRPR
jgi:Tol biopolymer transport system component